jgi:2-polyprenyl-3-methyl-5-hydroxy-6-metoxy-1,4-benzoquinol methylase
MFTEKEVLQTTGEASAAFPAAMKKMVVPRLAGLAERLDAPGATFLDVGVGVAELSMEMARLWPGLRIVGLDPWEPSLTLARENVKRAGLTDRIELRPQRAEEMTDVEAFDLAWLPTLFIQEQVMTTIVERLRSSLRPGGWLLFAMFNQSLDPVTTALARLRTALWGGRPWTPAEAEALLNQAQFVEVSTLPSPPHALIAMVVGRRA